MNKTQKNLLFLIIVCSAFLLTACDYEYYLYHDYIRENTEVVQIDLVNYNNPIDTEKFNREYCIRC